MNELRTNLIQHTPMIHFQADQAGATLRATELKPKLDSYLISQREGGFEAMPDGWKVGMGKLGQKALDYKVRITPAKIITESIPEKQFDLYFGDTGKQRGMFSTADGVIDLRFYAWDTTLLDHIKTHLGHFFLKHNFGTRQSKGFGSFALSEEFEVPNHFFSFQVKSPEHEDLFDAVNLFYKTLRGGINGINFKVTGKNRDEKIKKYISGETFYCKPLIFAFAKSNNIQWEKKTIKEVYFPNAKNLAKKSENLLDQQNNKRKFLSLSPEQKAELPLFFSHEDKKNVRDVLGLSSVQLWRGYDDDAVISKKECDEEGNILKDPKITRFKSPITFKPILSKDKKSFTVYFFSNPIPDEFLEQYFKSRFAILKEEEADLHLPIWSDFSLEKFLEFAFRRGTIEAMLPAEGNVSGYGKELRKAIQDIYNDIRKNLPNA